MTRAAERPPATNHAPPEETWDDEHIAGESPDSATRQALNLAHRAADKFPELANRYRSFAGPAVIVSGALVLLAGVAVARRARRGQKPEEILEQITPAEIESAATVTHRQNRWWRRILRIARRRRDANGEPAIE
jgi:hypothetical protein